MSEIQRRRVPEWRVTYKTGPLDDEDTLTVRWWIEADPEHGGIVDLVGARMAAVKAMLEINEGMSAEDEMEVQDLVEKLLELVPAANSVEVTDHNGDGMTIHRDWP